MFVLARRSLRAVCFLFVYAALAPAQNLHSVLHRPEKTASVLMLSDLHFDPFSDPGKFQRLRSAAADGWLAILEAPASADQAAAFNNLQSKCKARGFDSSWNLVRNSLQSARLRSSRAAFVTIGGDLLVHNFDCRTKALAPEMTEAEVSAFAGKSIAFLALQMHRIFAGTPVYQTLGNNDSGCADYRETPGSLFLKNAGQSFAGDAPAGDAGVFENFSEYGDYSVALPAPLQHARLIVLQDIFLSGRYATCGGKKLMEPDKGQIDWLRQQLEKAKAAGEQVWVMAHIPPGVDIYASFHNYVLQPARLCEVKTPTMYLHSDALTETLASFPDTVRLALFAHSHMDEFKLLHKAGSEGPESVASAVPAKIVPSISPVNGNHPAFLLADVSVTNATMLDYTAYTASDLEGTRWAKTYSFRSTYGAEDFSAKSVARLTSSLREDKAGNGPVSRAYRQWFLPGDTGLIGLGLQLIWPAYSCAASETDAAAFNRCLCPATPAAPSPSEAKP